MFHSKTVSLFAAAVIAGFAVAGTANAATIGHWRFESGSFTDDSSANSLDLTNTGVDTYTLSGTGAGSDFPSPIPQTGTSNGQAAQLDRVQSDKFSVADAAVLSAIATNKAFTAEGFVHLTERDDTVQYLISQIGSSQNSFGFQPSGPGAAANNNMHLLLSSDGINFDGVYNSGIFLELNKDYYIAVAVDLNQADSDDRVVFYAQNLTDGSPLQVANMTGVTATSIHDSTADLAIGNVAAGNRGFDGYLDEVRLSSTQLSQSELLISIPEPASLAMGLFGMTLIAARRRR